MICILYLDSSHFKLSKGRDLFSLSDHICMNPYLSGYVEGSWNAVGVSSLPLEGMEPTSSQFYLLNLGVRKKPSIHKSWPNWRFGNGFFSSLVRARFRKIENRLRWIVSKPPPPHPWFHLLFSTSTASLPTSILTPSSYSLLPLGQHRGGSQLLWVWLLQLAKGILHMTIREMSLGTFIWSL